MPGPKLIDTETRNVTDVFGQQARAQRALERLKQTGPVMRPVGKGEQLLDWLSDWELPGGWKPLARQAKDPYNKADWEDVGLQPGNVGAAGVTRIAPGASSAVQKTLREGINRKNLATAEASWPKEAFEALKARVEKHPRFFAHQRISAKPPADPRATMSFNPVPGGSRALRDNPDISPKAAKLLDPDIPIAPHHVGEIRASNWIPAKPTDVFHEGWHGKDFAKSGKTADEFLQHYNDLTEQMGYRPNPYERSSRIGEEGLQVRGELAERTPEGQRLLPGIRPNMLEEARLRVLQERMNTPVTLDPLTQSVMGLTETVKGQAQNMRTALQQLRQRTLPW